MHIVYVRPDLLLTRAFPPLDTLNFGERSWPVVYMPGAHCAEGRGDWLAVGTERL